MVKGGGGSKGKISTSSYLYMHELSYVFDKNCSKSVIFLTV